MPMLSDYQEVHEQLLSNLAFNIAGYSEMQKVENCFKYCMEYWNRVQGLVKDHGFSTRTEEIHFFKEVKPSFTGRIEYYTHQYHAMLFKPADDVLEINRFWRWEIRKIERFYADNEAFCRYIREGATNMDEKYFLRANGNEVRPSPVRIYDLDPATMTSHDHLVTLIRAYALYERYIRDQMKKHEDIFFKN